VQGRILKPGSMHRSPFLPSATTLGDYAQIPLVP
jgi:hypothetical protein